MFDHERRHAPPRPGAGTPVAVPAVPGKATRVATQVPPRDNSYNRGTLAWQGGTALQEDEIAQWGAARLKLVTGAIDYVMWTTGWDGLSTDSILAKLEAEVSDRYDRELFVRDAKVAHMRKEISHLESLETRTPFEDELLITHQLQLPLAITEAITFRDEREGAITRVTKDVATIAGAIASYGSTGASLATQVLDHATGAEPATFKSLADALDAAGAVVNALAFAAKAYDRTALAAFEANPSFETAAAWGKQVGDLLGHAGAAAGSLPFPWNQVIGGIAAMPRTVIAQFTELVRAHYAKVDAMTRGDACQKSELLGPGETACAK